MLDADNQLEGQERPTPQQIAWVIRCLANHIEQPGTFRVLLYDRLSLKQADYARIYLAGGMSVHNALIVAIEQEKQHED